MHPPLETVLEEAKGIKRATGVIRQGVLHIKLPRHWSRGDKDEAVSYLSQVLYRQHKKDQALLDRLDRFLESPEGQGQLITLDSERALTQYVRALNEQTFNVPVRGVKIGQARFSRLAQMNIETRTMTVSKYCLKGVPEPALRYLLIHELAHLLEASHNRRFWSLVGQFVPDYKTQSKIIKAFHKRAVDLDAPAAKNKAQDPFTQASSQQQPSTTPLPGTPPEKRHWWQLKLF